MNTIHPTRVLSSTGMAKDLGIDRSTLVRLEQRLIIPKAPIVTEGMKTGRVYDAALAAQVRAAYSKYSAKRLGSMVGRPPAPKKIIHVERL